MPVPTNIFLFKRSNGFYYIVYLQDGRKKWKSTRSKNRSEALKALTQLQKLLNKPPEDPPLSKFTPEYILHVKASLAPDTVAGYESALRSLLAFVGDCRLSSITLRQIDAFIVHRLKRVKPVTVNIDLRALRAGFNVARKWGLLETNPFSEVRNLRVPESMIMYFSKEDMKHLMQSVEETWLREVIQFAVGTGMRSGEILNLRWEDVDIQRGLVSVQSTISFSTKHGRKRVIPMSELVWKLIASKSRLPTCDFVFHRKGRKITKSYLTHVFKRAVRKAGLNDRLHFHSLRHTFASWLAQDGVSLYAIQKLLGHSSSAVTQVYSHLQPHELRDEVERISVVMN